MTDSDKADDALKIEVVVEKDGEPVTYELVLDDVDGLERRAFRQAVGIPIDSIGRAVALGQLDNVEALAAILWIVRRRDESDLTYDEVLSGVDGKSFRVPEKGDPEPNPPD